MKVLVTGGAGFIGSHITELLLQAGHEAVVLDDLSTGCLKNLHALTSAYSIGFIKADVADPKAVADPESYDAVVHCAAHTKVVRSNEEPSFDAKTNIGGVENIARMFPDTRIVFLSTLGAMFGDRQFDEGEITERTEPRPPSVYGMNKMLGEIVLGTWTKRTTVLRLANVFGPRQRSDLEGGVVSIFLELAEKGEPLTVFGNGHQSRDFIHVRDVAELVLRVLEEPSVPDPQHVSGPFHVNSGKATSVFEIVENILEYAELDVRHAPSRDEIMHTPFPPPRRAQALFQGWNPGHGHGRSLRGFIEEVLG